MINKREEFWIRSFLLSLEFEDFNEEEAAKRADKALIEYDRRWPSIPINILEKEIKK